MKKNLCLLAIVIVIASCSENAPKVEPAIVVAEKPAKIDYGKDIKYTEWEIGKPEHVKTVLNFYTFWDNKEMEKLSSLFSDTLRLRIPGVRNELAVPNAKIGQSFAENRGEYKTTTNQILSALSLHDRESNEDWVMITTYSKWEETSGKRDSVMFSDSWRMKDGKISFLMSFDKVPTKNFLNTDVPVK